MILLRPYILKVNNLSPDVWVNSKNEKLKEIKSCSAKGGAASNLVSQAQPLKERVLVRQVG